MRSSQIRWIRLSIVAFAAVMLAGCAKDQPEKNHQTSFNAEPRRASAKPPGDGGDLDPLVQSLGNDSNQLPGRTADDHRRLVQRVFSDLSQILPALAASESNTLAQRVAAIQQSRSQLANASASVAVAPAIDTGLRSAYNALRDLSHTSPYQQNADLQPGLDRLKAQLDRLDLDRGPLHQVDVAIAVDQMSQIVSKMAQLKNAQMSRPSAGPATQQSASSAAE